VIKDPKRIWFGAMHVQLTVQQIETRARTALPVRQRSGFIGFLSSHLMR
jgi:hypothetical protein